MGERIKAGFWWRSLRDTFDKVCREFVRKARAAEQAEKGHECGHRWEISVRSSLHVSGPGEHTDADWWGDYRPVTVRAHNLRDALLIAATLPLPEWFEDEENVDETIRQALLEDAIEKGYDPATGTYDSHADEPGGSQ